MSSKTIYILLGVGVIGVIAIMFVKNKRNKNPPATGNVSGPSAGPAPRKQSKSDKIFAFAGSALDVTSKGFNVYQGFKK